MKDRRSYWVRVALGAETDPPAALCRAALSPLSAVYGALMRIRNSAYDLGILRSERLPAPTVSVGNISVGGTGKTPMVEWVAKQLLDMGGRPAILSRGYGARIGKGAKCVNDESAVLAQNIGSIPHVCNPDRLAGARQATATMSGGADCFVLDDGFQYRRARRDLDLVLVDASIPYTTMRLLPYGSLREPLSSLRRAHVIVLTHTDICSPIRLQAVRRMARKAAPHLPVAEMIHVPVSLSVDGAETDATSLKGRKIFAFCGIGNPESFTRMLENLGAEIVESVYFPDHHPYTVEDCALLKDDAARLGAEMCVTTQKDAVKVTPLWGAGLSVLKVAIEVTVGRDMLLGKLRGILAR